MTDVRTSRLVRANSVAPVKSFRIKRVNMKQRHAEIRDPGSIPLIEWDKPNLPAAGENRRRVAPVNSFRIKRVNMKQRHAEIRVPGFIPPIGWKSG